MLMQGSLDETPLSGLVLAMQSERATGTLTVERDSQQSSLYFLFGHLFHADGASGQGETVVIDALGWPAGTFNFDPRAKLPADETIKLSVEELIEQAGINTDALDPFQPAVASSGDDTAVAASMDAPAPTEDEEALPAAPPTEDESGAPVYSPAETYTPPSYETEAMAPTSYDGTSTAPPSSWDSPVPSYEPPTMDPVETPEPVAVPAAAADDDDTVEELYPLPSGTAVYEGLKSAFVDFPKLLKTLRSDSHTGYIRLSDEGFGAVLLLHDGHLLEALYSSDVSSHGEHAFRLFRDRMESGVGLIDVIILSGDTIVALAQLLTAKPMYRGLLGRFVNFDALLEHLEEEKIDGSVVVRTDGDTGVILLRKGAILAAYTSEETDLQKSTASVSALAADHKARIEVTSGTEAIAGIDIESILASA